MHQLSFTTTPISRVPRPCRDRIRSPFDALSIVALAAPRPMASRSFVIVTDRQRRGIGLALASRGTRPSAARLLSIANEVPCAAGLVVVTTRERRTVAPGDAAAWESLRGSLLRWGAELVEWIVAGPGGFYCPRVLTSTPDPWDESVESDGQSPPGRDPQPRLA